MRLSQIPTRTKHNIETVLHSWGGVNYHQCTLCWRNWQKKPDSDCPGVPVYMEWPSVPDTMTTKTMLRKEHKKKLAKEQAPTAYKWNQMDAEYIPLYLISEAIDLKPPTEAQTKALEKARYMAESVYVGCPRCGRELYEGSRKHAPQPKHCWQCQEGDKAREWAKNVLETKKNIVIFDTETTDLNGEIIEIAVIDLDGNVLLNTRIKPVGEMNPDAERVHGISLEMLANKPSFADIYPELCRVFAGQAVLSYNVDFDEGRVKADCKRHGLEVPQWSGTNCIMEMYARWHGDWSTYWDSFKWQSLGSVVPSADHSALGDAQAALEALKILAGMAKHYWEKEEKQA
jgi:DNA polymerase-3 subunit epsilon